MPALHVDEHLAGNVYWTSFIKVENKPGTFPKIDFINNPKPEQRADHVPHSYFFFKTCRNILRPTFTGLSLIQCPKPPKCDCNGIVAYERKLKTTHLLSAFLMISNTCAKVCSPGK